MEVMKMSKKKIKLADGQIPNQTFWERAVETLQALVNWKYECAIEDVADEMNEGDRVIAVLYPEEMIEVTSFQHRYDNYTGFDFDESEVEDEFGLCISYDSDCVVTLGENRYLVEAPLLIFNIDRDGNECSVTPETILQAAQLLSERETCIEVDEEAYPAIRLDC